MAARPAFPKLVHHKPRNLARVKLAGRVFYLGKWGSDEAREAYAKIVADCLAGRTPEPPPKPTEAAKGCTAYTRYTIGRMVEDFTKHAEGYYLKAGKKTTEVDMINAALLFLKPYEDFTATEFKAADLRAVRDKIVGHKSTNKHRKGKRLSRYTVNQYISRIVRAFRWAAVEGHINPETAAALAMLPGLRAGRTTAPEGEPVRPVDDKVVEATTPHMPKVLGDMVKVQRLCGMRPGEVVAMRPADLDTKGDIWLYTPPHHKTEHRGKTRTVYIGPKARAILAPYLEIRGMHEHIFRPDQQPFVRLVERRYQVGVYATAVKRACKRAKVEAWTPNQLRHTAATEARKVAGLEGAQLMLGHARVSMTQHYAEVNTARGVELAQLLG
jgi:integrase